MQEFHLSFEETTAPQLSRYETPKPVKILTDDERQTAIERATAMSKAGWGGIIAQARKVKGN